MSADAKTAPAAAPKFDLPTLLKGSKGVLIDAKGQTYPVATALKDKVVGLYFSASWCGPCRHFTPTLAQVYKECQKQNKPLEIVFISRDRSEADFDKYFKSEMPWLALPYEERALQETLNDQFEVDGIPHFHVFAADGTVLNPNARGLVDALGVDAYPWVPPRVKPLDAASDTIYEQLCLFALMEGSDAGAAAGAGGASTAAAAAPAHGAVSEAVRAAVMAEIEGLAKDPLNKELGLIVAHPKTRSGRWRQYTGVTQSPCVMITDFRGEKNLKYVDSAPFAVGAATAFLKRYRDGLSGAAAPLAPFVKSAPRPAADADPSHPGVTIATANTFQQLVLDASKHVFLDVFADWCGPCKQFAPHLHRVAKALKQTEAKDIVIATINSDDNDVDRTYLPETSIPNLKLFPKGAKTATTQIKYDGKRTDVDLLNWLDAKAPGCIDVKACAALVTQWGEAEAKEAAAKKAAADAAFVKLLANKQCTFAATGTTYKEQKFWGCKTCNKPGMGVCESCKDQCHKGHELTDEDTGMFFCDCGAGDFASVGAPCKCMPK